jgi:thiamine biosynthesis protein ThiC
VEKFMTIREDAIGGKNTELFKACATGESWKIVRCRNNLDWKGQIELFLNPAKAARFSEEGLDDKGPTCSMCGSY